MHYCAACRSKQVQVADGLCEKCALEGREPGNPSHHSIDGYELVKKTLSVLNAAVEALRTESQSYDGRDEEARAAFMKRMSELGRAVGMVAKEARAFEQYMAKEVKTLTKEQKLQIIVPFFEGLPADQQRSLMQRLTRSYNERSGFKVQERKS